jgi:transposase
VLPEHPQLGVSTPCAETLVIEMERRVLLKHYLLNGMSKTAAARALGITRQTVHRWTSEASWETELGERVPRYRPRPPVPTKLDPYEAIIRTRLEEYPELS